MLTVFVREEHLNYFDLHTDQAADFIHRKLAAAAGRESPDPVSPATTKPPGSVDTVTLRDY